MLATVLSQVQKRIKMMARKMFDLRNTILNHEAKATAVTSKGMNDTGKRTGKIKNMQIIIIITLHKSI